MPLVYRRKLSCQLFLAPSVNAFSLFSWISGLRRRWRLCFSVLFLGIPHAGLFEVATFRTLTWLSFALLAALGSLGGFGTISLACFLVMNWKDSVDLHSTLASTIVCCSLEQSYLVAWNLSVNSTLVRLSASALPPWVHLMVPSESRLRTGLTPIFWLPRHSPWVRP